MAEKIYSALLNEYRHPFSLGHSFSVCLELINRPLRHWIKLARPQALTRTIPMVSKKLRAFALKSRPLLVLGVARLRYGG